jgi:CMP-N,N'-diacetyllegionaminic acid synthase
MGFPVIRDQRVIAIIPARGGSQGLPGKNIRDLCGKPLIAWSIETALRSKLIDEVLVTTDDATIADVAKRHGASVPFMRPPALATSTSPTISAVEHALAYYREKRGEQFGYTALLEPTSPLREDDDIDRMVAALDQARDRFDGIVSVGEVNEHPSIVKRIREHAVAPYCPELDQTDRRQDNEPAWFPYGVAYITKTDVLLAHRSFYPPRCMAFPIQRYQNYEIDSIYDFVCVEAIMRHMKRGA